LAKVQAMMKKSTYYLERRPQSNLGGKALALGNDPKPFAHRLILITSLLLLISLAKLAVYG